MGTNNYKLKYAIVTIFVICAALFGANFYVKNLDTSGIKEELQNRISSVSGTETRIENTYLTLLPYPKAILRRITINKGIFIDRAEIEPHFFSLLRGKLQESLVNVNNVYINPKKTGFHDKNTGAIIDSIAKLDSKVSKIKIAKLWDTAINNRIILTKLAITRKSGNVFTEFHFSKNIKVQDSSIYNPKDGIYQAETNVSNASFSFMSQRSFDANNTIGGNFSLDIHNIGAFSLDVSSYFDFIFNSYLRSPKALKISGIIGSDKDNVVFHDIKILNESVDITGSYWSSKNSQIDVLDLKIAKLDLSDLYAGPDLMNTTEESIAALDASNLKIQIQGDNISFFGDQINHFILLGVGDGAGFNIQNCTGNFGQNGNFNIYGGLTNNQYRPKFMGYIEAEHNDFNALISDSTLSGFATDISAKVNLLSKLSITPIDIMLQNFKLTIGGQNVRGNVNFKFSGSDNLLLADLDIDDVNLDQSNLPFIKQAYDYFKSLGRDMSGQVYAAKYTALRTYPLKTSMNIVGDNIIADNTNIDRLSLVASFEPGILRIDNYMLSFGDTYFSGNAKIVANSLKPQIRFNISDGVIVTGSITQDATEEFIKYLNNNINLAVVELSSEINLKSLKQDNLEMKSLSCILDGKNGSLSVPKLNFNIFDGQVELNGNMAINPIKLSFAFGVDGMQLGEVNNILPEKTDLASGLASINGQISATGNDLKQILYNIYIQGNFLAKDLTIQHLDMYNIITQLSSADLTQDKADNILKANIGFSAAGTDFADAQGAYDLDNGILSIKNILLSSKFFTASSGITLNLYNNNALDLNTIFSFYPVGAQIFSPSNVTPIKLRLIAKGSIFSADKSFAFDDRNDIYRIPKLLNNPIYAPPRYGP